MANTNKNPKVIAYYYLTAIEELGFLPAVMRTDNGTENTIIELLQIGLRLRHNDNFAGTKSFFTGRSVRNQRIESFWGRMRQHSMDFYIQFFKSMQEKNLFDGSNLHIQCLRYCFGPLIQEDLQMTKILLNEHKIRKQALRNNKCGKPDVMYNLPELFDAKDYRKPVDLEAVARLKTAYATKPSLVDPHFQELVELVLPNAETPSNSKEALSLYKKILHRIDLNRE